MIGVEGRVETPPRAADLSGNLLLPLPAFAFPFVSSSRLISLTEVPDCIRLCREPLEEPMLPLPPVTPLKLFLFSGDPFESAATIRFARADDTMPLSRAFSVSAACADWIALQTPARDVLGD